MANVNNYGHLEGRLTKNPVFFTNSDGSRKVYLTLAVKRNRPDKVTGEIGTDFIECEGFIPAGKTKSVFDCMSMRDRIGLNFTLEHSQYEKDGQMVYKQAVRIQDVALRETKAEAQRHREMAGLATPAVKPAAAPIVAADDVFVEEDEAII